MAITTCPESGVLALLMEERLSPPLRGRVEAHVEGCAACQGRLDRLGREGAPLCTDHLGRDLAPEAGPSTVSFLARIGDRGASRPPAPEWPRVDGYEILGELGSGGMGWVYRARHLGLGREVAIKVIRPGPSAGLFRGRLEREAMALARLRHPNIVQVHDIGISEGQTYLSLELIEGTTLAAWMGGAPQAPDVAAGVALVLARGVDYAHRNGILHRDLKPANILIESPPDGGPGDSSKAIPPRIKITDFGLAKAIVEGDSSPGGLTATGELIGTPQYMAPEQASDLRGPIGPGADIYALGVILYELLAGQPPFRAETPLKTILQVIHEVPPGLSRFRPRIPADLATICMKCLEKTPSRRYPSAGAFAEDLRRFLAREPIAARPVGPAGRLVRWGQRKPWLAAMAGAVVTSAALAFGLVFWQWRTAEAARVRAEGLATSEAAAKEAAKDERNKAERLAVELLLDYDLSTCERGEIEAGLEGLARTLRRAEASGLGPLAGACRANIACWSRRLAAASTSPPLGSSATSVAWSPDGRRLLVGQWANLHNKPGPAVALLWDPDGWKPIGPPLVQEGSVTAVAWSPDGRLILTSANDGAVRTWDAATGMPVGPLLRALGSAKAAAFHPDGRRFAAGGAAAGAGDRGAVCIWDAGAGVEAPIATYSFAGPVEAIAFSPDGELLATAARAPGTEDASAGAEVCQWDLATQGRRGPRLIHSSAVRALAYSPDGKRLATGGHDRMAILWDRATGKRTGNPFVYPGMITTLAFSPDGKALAIGGGESRLAGEPVARLSAAALLGDVATGKPRSEPLGHPDVVHGIAFDPGSRRLATACRDGYIRIFEANPDVSVERTLPFACTSLTFSPDGGLLVVAGGQGGADGGISEVLDPATGDPVRAPIRHATKVWAVAIERRSGAYAVSLEDGEVGIFDLRTDRPLGGPLEHADCPESLSFSEDGERLLATAFTKASRLWDWRAGRLAWETRAGDYPNSASLGPDGRLILINRRGKGLDLWDVAQDAPAAELRPGSPPRYLCSGFSPDGRLAIAGDDDRVVRCWELASRRSYEASLGKGVVWQAGFIGAGPRAYAVAGYENPSYGHVYFWDPFSGDPPKRLPHLVNIRAVAFSPDHRFLATGGWTGGVRLWDAATGYQIGPELTSTGSVVAIACSPDGRTLAAADENKTLSIWRIPLPGPSAK